MKKTSKIMRAALCSIAATVAILLFALGKTVTDAKGERDRYAASSAYLAICDLADATKELRDAINIGDAAAAYRAGGRAEAYLSRAGLEGCESVYALISGILSGEFGKEACEKLAKAAEMAREGDGGEALRSLLWQREPEEESYIPETTEDELSARILHNLGRGGADVSEKRARAFCCPNAAFERCESDVPATYKFSGDNIFISLEGERARVTMYCFDRELDERYSISAEDAEKAVKAILEKEKLRLPTEPEKDFNNGIFSFIYRSDSGEAIASFEIYGDTGRLRKFDAVNYYAKNE
jgi:hypothetical protein